MPWDPTRKPRLRSVEAFPVSENGTTQVALHDRSGLSEVMISVSGPALQVLALMDGEHTCEVIRREFAGQFGQELSIATLQGMLEQLDCVHLLEGPAFEEFYQDRLDAFRARAIREMPQAEALGITEGDGALFDDMLTDAPPPALRGQVRGLVAPHLDYPRGRPCYATAYSMLKGRPAPRRVVVLGTNHFGRSPSVVATGSAFRTPFGTTPTDLDFLQRLEAQFGDLRRHELDHAREHSIELQVLWLQHLFGADAFHMVAFLCPDPCGPTGTKPYDGNGVDLTEFADALGHLVAENPSETLIIAGADLSHVGGAFGDEKQLDETFLNEVRNRDQQALDHIARGDPMGFWRAVARDQNPTRVCSAGCIFTLAKALTDSRATILGYHQAADQPTQTCVTCTAIAFT